VKVVHVTLRFDAPGGVETNVREVTRRLRAAGDDVRRIFDKLELAHGIAADVSRAVKKGEVYQAERIVNFKFEPHP